MTTFIAKDRSRGHIGGRLPDNGGGWLNNKALADLVLEAVRAVDEKELNPPAPGIGGPAFRPRMMLAALTYCYAVGIFGSQDIEEMMRCDGGVRALCGMEFPDWRRLRRFRRENREMLRRTLEETIRRAWSLNRRDRVQPTRSQTQEVNETLPTNAPGNEALTPDWLSREAGVRIQRAMFIDQMTLDD
jgi:hypothetical protein